MTTNRTTIRGAAILIVTFTTLCGRAEEPEKPSAFPHPVTLQVSLERASIEACEPTIAHVTLTNRGHESFRLPVQDDGAPYYLALIVSPLDDSWNQRSRALRHSHKKPREFELAPGESTSGDILLLFDQDDGYVVSSPGLYRLRGRWSPGPGFAKVESQALALTVLPASPVNEGFLRRLGFVAFRYHTGKQPETLAWDTPEGKRALERESVLLLRRLISQNQPHLVKPEDHPETAMVDALTKLLREFPNSAYSGYVARFLGLVHVKTFEYEGSHRGAGSWGETKASADHKEVRQLCQSEYEKGLHYLTIASQADLWPRTTAAFHLARLHGMAEEWAKVSSVCDKLRTDYAEQNGTALADKLESEMRKYREKISRRKEADQSSGED